MNEGKYIFTQVLSFVPRQIFQRLVAKYKGNYRVRGFNCSNQLRYMLFGQLTPCESLRDICLCLNAHRDILYGLGITAAVNESSLSRANENRDYRIYEGLGQAMIKQVHPLYSKMRLEYIYPQDHDVFALDSTTISCSVNLMSWAMGKYSKGAVKMHTLIDLRGSIPVFIHITDGRFMTAMCWICLTLPPTPSTRWTRHMLISMRSIALMMKRHSSSPAPRTT